MSDGVEWGLHCAALLAFLPDGSALPAARLAEYHGVPAAYLAKHLQAMARAGILESRAGPRGGYRLARPASEVTVLDVVEAVDGSDSAFRCSEIRRRGPTASAAKEYRVPCAVHRTMARADDAWRASLSETTIADLTEMIVTDASDVVLRKGGRWLDDVLATPPERASHAPARRAGRRPNDADE